VTNVFAVFAASVSSPTKRHGEVAKQFAYTADSYQCGFVASFAATDKFCFVQMDL